MSEGYENLKFFAGNVANKEAELTQAKAALLEAVQLHLKRLPGNASDLARQMGFSRSYLCDIQHGKRMVSKAFVRKLEGL